jgi:hypothetical protein
MAAEVMVMGVTAVVAICMLGDTVMAGVVTRMVVMVGQAMPIADLLMATVMVAQATVTVIQATVMLTMGMAGGIMVTGILAMVAGGVAAGTLMVLERAGASAQQQVGYGSATNPDAVPGTPEPNAGFNPSRGQPPPLSRGVPLLSQLTVKALPILARRR